MLGGQSGRDCSQTNCRKSDSMISKRYDATPDYSGYQANHTQIKDMSESPSPERVLIDVREPSEYQAGYIPSAINLPVISQPDALTMSEEDFEDRYGFAKPARDQEVVFYCKAGVRSGNAASIAQQQGYSNVSEYKGSWSDWTKRGGTEAL